MVANGLLTNPTLLTGTNHTTLECVQQWTDICYNSTLDLNHFQKLTTKKNLAPIIPEKPPNLTFQCFHHHLVFMLEKLLPRRKRQVFNSLQKFADVLDFLENEFNIVPRIFSVSDYFKTCTSLIDYENSNELYHNLKKKIASEILEDDNEWRDQYEQSGVFFENIVSKTNSGFDGGLLDLFSEHG